MSTTPTPTESTPAPTPKAAKAAKGSRSYSVTLAGPDGSTLKITAQRKRNGSAITFATHTTVDGKKRSRSRGATSQHPDLERAKGAAERLAIDAVKRGWTRKERAAGFTPKPDTFDAAHLPTPKPSRK